MSWEMQIHMGEEKGWVSVQGSHLPNPYRYETKEEAERMLCICYPDPALEREKKRVVEVDEPANTKWR